MTHAFAGLQATLTDGWGLFGLAAQGLFTGSFLTQWIASERAGASIVPRMFWHLRLIGGLMLLTYALLGRHDAVIVIGQATGAVVYLRNLMLLRRADGLPRHEPA